jgi:hypothetical protein
MIVRVWENQHINRTLLEQGDKECIKKLRGRLQREGMDTNRKLTADFTVPGTILFTYFDSPHSVYAHPLTFRRVSKEEQYRKNLLARDKRRRP